MLWRRGFKHVESTGQMQKCFLWSREPQSSQGSVIHVLICPQPFLISSHLGNHTAAGFHIRQSGLMSVGISKWTMILLTVCYLWRWALVTADCIAWHTTAVKKALRPLKLIHFTSFDVFLSPNKIYRWLFYLYNNKIHYFNGNYTHYSL